jgi:hypothetical protein
MDHDDDLGRRLEARADRGDVTGPDEVWARARAQADRAPAPRRGRLAVAAVFVVGALVAGAVAIAGEGDGNTPLAKDAATTTRAPQVLIAQNASYLAAFADCDAVLAELQAEALQRVGPFGLDGGLVPGRYRAFEGHYVSPTYDGFIEQSGGGRPAGSTTNTQEAGVDEPDLVETDGEHLYDVHGGTLRVVDVEAAELTDTLPLGLVDVVGAVLVGDDLVVFGNEPLLGGRRGEARIVVIDVAGGPVVRERMTIDGTLVDVRAVGGRVNVVTVSGPTIEFTYPADGGEDAEDAATEANKDRIRASTLADWLPARTVIGADGETTAERAQLTECPEIRSPEEFGGFDQTSLVTLELGDLAASHSTSVQASSLLVYGSTDSVYTATTPYGTGGGGDTWGRPAITDSHTDLHRFTLGEEPRYAGSGRVAGLVDDQLGISEHDGHLRVASSTVGGPSDSRVTVLRIDGGELVETGLVDGLGPNETLEGVRFVGDLGYVVTFRRTDPLYVVDLRDPTAPRLAGELQIPGYSEYLHPVGDGLVLGVGVDGTEDGRIRGAAMSLFDVSDPAAPRRVDLESFGVATASKIDGDHHAFTWSPDSSTAYVPVGLLMAGHEVEAVRVEGSALTLVGRVRPAGEGAPAKAAFDRTVIVGDRLLSVSPTGVQVSDVGSLAPLAWVAFP